MKYIRMLLVVVGLFVAGGTIATALADDNNPDYGPARAFPPSPIIGIYVPFRGSVFNSDAGENVTLAGQLHVTVQMREKVTFTRAFIVAIDSAMGEMTGDTYDLIVPERHFTFPPGPIRDAINIQMALFPPNPIAPAFYPPGPVRLQLIYSRNGVVTGGMVSFESP